VLAWPRLSVQVRPTFGLGGIGHTPNTNRELARPYSITQRSPTVKVLLAVVRRMPGHGRDVEVPGEDRRWTARDRHNQMLKVVRRGHLEI
jgi:hypothetical protein